MSPTAHCNKTITVKTKTGKIENLLQKLCWCDVQSPNDYDERRISVAAAPVSNKTFCPPSYQEFICQD